MNTELENIQQQVSALQENTDLITQDIVRIMPTIVSLLCLLYTSDAADD